jgi:hypothetical protein
VELTETVGLAVSRSTPGAEQDVRRNRGKDVCVERQRILDVMEIQLRDYRIRQGHMDDWIAGWQNGVVRLRQHEGFVLIGAWVDRSHDRFLWVVGYSGADGFKAAEARYHGSPARVRLTPNPSDFVDTATLDMVDAVS